MINTVIRYLHGYVDLVLFGPDMESFINFCAKNEIVIISYEKNGYSLLGKFFTKDYKKIKRFCVKKGIDAKIKKKHGIIFDFRKKIKNIGFVAGMIFIFCFLYFMNLFIWEINVIGNEKIETKTIMDCAKEVGLVTGTLSGKHFVQDMEWYILRENPGLASVEINIQGSVANILVNETSEFPEMVSDDDIPVNLIASKYGVVRKINVFDGQSSVKEGDAVFKGDLLVSAVYEDRHNKLTLKHARAEVIAETDFGIDIEFQLEEKIFKKDGLKNKIYEIIILGKRICFGNHEKFSAFPSEKSEEKLNFFWIELPINLITTRYFNVKENTVTYNFEQGRSKAFELLEAKEKELMEETEILSRKTEEKIKNGKYIINADYIVLMDIAEEQPIESDVPWENSDDIS